MTDEKGPQQPMSMGKGQRDTPHQQPFEMVKAVMLDGLADYTGRTGKGHDEPWWNLNMPKALDIMLSHLAAHGYSITPAQPSESDLVLDVPAPSDPAGRSTYQPKEPT